MAAIVAFLHLGRWAFTKLIAKTYEFMGFAEGDFGRKREVLINSFHIFIKS